MIANHVLPFRQRGNSDLKDNYGSRHVRVKEHGKVLCHPMSGVIAITVKQLFNMLESINSSSFNIETMKRPQRRERVETHKHFWQKAPESVKKQMVFQYFPTP